MMAVEAMEAAKAVKAAPLAVKAAGSPSRSDGKREEGIREEKEGE